MHLATSFTGPRGVRYPAPDVARGFMLLLIALANVSVWAATVRSGSPGSAADTAWIWVRTLLVTSRAYPLFAMLFGFGLTVMINRRIASGTRARLQRLGAAGAGREPTPAEEAWAREQATVDARRLVRRRGLWMILFGFVHGIFFYGDIIGTYGSAAVVFAGWLARKHRKRALAVCVLLTLILIWTRLNAGATAAIMGTTYAEAVAQEQVHAEGLFVFVSNVQRWAAQSVAILGVASTIVPAMFIGARLADTDVMADPRKHRGPLVAVAVGGLVIGAASAVGARRGDDRSHARRRRAMTACTSARPGADASMDAHRATAEGDHMNDQAPPTTDRADRAVTIRSLVKRYGELIAVDGLSLEIGRGEVLGLLGPNGSGKTTTINCLLQLLTYDKGEIRVFGRPMSATAYDLKRRIGVVPQEVAVFDELTVAENIDAFCALYVGDRARRRRLVEAAIAFVDLEKFASFRPKRLSGGLLRRLNIACGIAHAPELIIFDEPTVAVDPQSRSAILQGIRRLNERGATIIYTSHYMEEVERLCDRIVIMDRGRQVASGTSDELKAMIGTGERIRLEVVDPVPLGEAALEGLRRLEHVRTATLQDGEVLIECSPGAHNLSDIMRTLDEAGATCGRVTSEPPTLNDVFLEITGRALRDEAA